MAMRHHANPSTVVCVTLTPAEGEQLFEFLTELAKAGVGQPCFTDLDELLDKVSQANALSVWLRENIQLELSSSEADELTQAVSEARDLSPIGDKLEAVYRMVLPFKSLH